MNNHTDIIRTIGDWTITLRYDEDAGIHPPWVITVDIPGLTIPADRSVTYRGAMAVFRTRCQEAESDLLEAVQ